jgi:hypothetical protein
MERGALPPFFAISASTGQMVWPSSACTCTLLAHAFRLGRLDTVCEEVVSFSGASHRPCHRRYSLAEPRQSLETLGSFSGASTGCGRFPMRFTKL